MIASLLTRTATITQASSGSGGDDGFGGGDPSPLPSTTDVPCYLEQRQRSEDETSEISDTSWLLVVPAGTDITTGDRVTVDGQIYEVAGEPWEAHAPPTGEHHVEVTLERTA